MTDLTLLITLSERLIAFALALQSIELLLIRRACADSGVWSFALISEEYAALPAPARWLFAQLMPYRSFVALLALRLAAALALLGFGARAALPLLFVTSVLVCVRFRGNFNGGSDSMTMLILFGLNLSAIAPETKLASVGFGYVGLQTLLSYFVAGLIKLRQPEWRNGRALAALATSPAYAPPRFLDRLFRRASLARIAAWSVMVFECGFPFALTSTRACSIALALGAAFHLANAFLFGLNRFVFAWLAAYPALFWLSTLG